MTDSNFQELFLDYIENILDAEQRARFEKELASNSELKAEFDRYKALISTEKALGVQHFQVRSGFADDLMSELDRREIGFFRRLFMELSINRRMGFAAVASAAMVALVVKLGTTGLDLHIQAPSKESPKVIINTSLAVDPGGMKNEAGTGGNALPPAPLLDETARDVVSAVTAKTVDLSGDADRERASEVLRKTLAERNEQGVRPNSDARNTLERAQSYNRAAAPMPVLEAQRAASAAGWALGGTAGRENYLSIPSSAPISPSQEALSTFSIDVDTASYTNVRRYLLSWAMPPEAAIRTEEFVNYFDYNYPEQFDKPFAVHTEIAPSPLTNGSYLMKVGIRAKDIKDSDKPWNLVFLVDVSGSMADPNKLPLVKQALTRLTDKMRPQDRIALVTYAGEAGLKLDSTPGSEKEKIRQAINALQWGGSTNGASGITVAYDTAVNHKIAGGVNRVILATDGDFNVGVTSHQELIRMIEEKRKLGISLTSIGVGSGNLNDATLEQLADKGNGNYFYLDSVKEAERVFSEKLAGTIETVAKDVKIQVEFNPQQIVQYKLVGYENRALAKQDFNNDTVDAGEIGAGHTVTALYEIVLANTPAAANANINMRYQVATPVPTIALNDAMKNEVAFVKVRFKEPDGDTSKLLEFPIARGEVKSDIGSASSDLRFAAAVAGFAEVLKRSPLGNSLTLKQIVALAEGNRGEDKAGQRQEFINLVRQAAAIMQQPL